MTKSDKLLFQKKTYDGLIEVWQASNQRWLTIDSIEQSRIDLNHSDQLASSLHQYFLAYQLFSDMPETILLGGLGAGALARYLSVKKPGINGFVIEANTLVVDLAKQYFDFPEAQWQVKIDDLNDFSFNKINSSFDLIVLDIAPNGLSPEWLTDEKLLHKLRNRLSDNGVLTINLLVSDAQSFSDKLKIVREVFECRTLCVNVPNHQNIVVFAFNKNRLFTTSVETNARAEQLTKYWGMDFVSMLNQIQKDNPKENAIF